MKLITKKRQVFLGYSVISLHTDEADSWIWNKRKWYSKQFLIRREKVLPLNIYFLMVRFF